MTRMIDARLVMPEDVAIVPVTALNEQLRTRLAADADDYAISRPASRVPARLISAGSKALLDRFRSPATIVEAVLSFARELGADPQQMLPEAFALLQSMVHAQVLVRDGSEAAAPIAETFTLGQRIGEFTLLRRVQLYRDTEVHQARADDGTLVAVKIARPGQADAQRPLFAREIAILRRLDPAFAPRLCAHGAHDDLPFLALDWREGRDALNHAHHLRATGDTSSLLQLVGRVTHAYSALHARRLIHGDVHPRNIIVSDAGDVCLIDFALAHAPDDPALPPIKRGGIPYFYEPEFARARLAGHRAPPASFAGEQFAVGAMAHLLLTGQHYCAFAPDEDAMLQQIAETPPQPMRASFDSPRSLELAVRRALAKAPEDRHADMADFTAALTAGITEYIDRTGSPKNTIRMSDMPLPGTLTAPLASVHSGAAGIAWALYRAATLTSDGATLAQADRWALDAARHRHRPDGFAAPMKGLAAAQIDPASLLHGDAGILAVQALIAHAMDDRVSGPVHRAALCSLPVAGRVDFVTGCAGQLAALTLVREAVPYDRGLADRSDELARALLAKMEGLGTIAAGPLDLLGAAHGWCGLLHALLLWSAVAHAPPPRAAVARLDELVALAQPAGAGMTWPRRRGRSLDGFAASWCNGAAGHVMLLVQASALLRDDRYYRCACRAGRYLMGTSHAAGDLCCGSGGAAYALLALWRSDGDDAWLRGARDKARSSAERCATADPQSLFKGPIGSRLLLGEIDDPFEARFPFFELAGWPSTPSSND